MQIKTSLFQTINICIIFLILCICSIGLLLLCSASGGNFYHWASKQCVRCIAGLIMLVLASSIDIRVWFKYAYFLFLTSVVLLVIVDILGSIGMGARRWIMIAGFTFQPSELVRIFLILSIARYFQDSSNRDLSLLPPILMILIPTLLLIRQPDLGTAILIILSTLSIFWVACVPIQFFLKISSLFLLTLPIVWNLLHNYQKKRIFVFLNPESDPLKSGYHIVQSKIAIGSGGMFGKGFLQGTQTQLDFLPEKHTDFIFALLGEEFGFLSEIILLILYICLIGYNTHLAFKCRSLFGKYVIVGLNSALFTYIVVNIGMVCGLLPVVGIPLPFVSYGGTAMITIMLSQGIIFSARNYNYSRVGNKNSKFF